MGKTETTTSEYPNAGNATTENILMLKERKKSKRAGLRVTVRDLSMKVKHLSKVIYYRNVITEYTRFLSSTKID